MNYPIDLNEVKCRINEGCFFAIGSYARYKLEKVPQENDSGTDFRLIKQILRNGSVCDMGSILEFQLKATVNWEEDDENIKYNLRSKNYNDIITRNVQEVTPLILILMCLPGNEENWINISMEEIIFRKNLYWFHTDSKELLSNEDSTKLILIPKSNLIVANTFKQLVQDFGVRKVN